MSELRTILINWLLAQGFGERYPGYGHATAERIAEALLEAFDIRFKD